MPSPSDPGVPTSGGKPLFKPTPDDWKLIKSVPIAKLLNGRASEEGCPFCGFPGFQISSHGKLWRCGGCASDRWHSGVSVLMKLHDIDALEAAWLLVRMAGDQ